MSGNKLIDANEADEEVNTFMKHADNKDAPTTPVLRGKSAELASIEHKPRTVNIWLFMIVVTMFSLNNNYVSSSLNQMKAIFRNKLGWVEDSQQEIWLY